MTTENPKHYAGQEKIPFGDVSGVVMTELSLAMHEGARKYAAYNYRETPVRASDYYAAMQRHIMQWWEFREDPDPTCGISHLVKAMACLAVLRDAEINGMMVDDRPPVVSGQHWARLQGIANDLRQRYPDPKPRVTEWGDKADLSPRRVRRRVIRSGDLADIEMGTYFDPNTIVTD